MGTTKKAPKGKKTVKVKDLTPKGAGAVRGGAEPIDESRIRQQ